MYRIHSFLCLHGCVEAVQLMPLQTQIIHKSKYFILLHNFATALVFLSSLDACTRFPTDDTLGKRGPLQRGQAQISYLHRASGPRDEDVVTFQVSVDDGRGPGVKEVEAFEDLSAPGTQNLDFHHLEALQVAA